MSEAVTKATVPAGAKKPADRQAKAEDRPDETVVTIRGKEFVISAESANDFELLDDLNSLDQRSDATRLPSVLRRLLGDQWRAAMDVLRDESTGRVSIDDGAEFVGELLEALNPNS